MQVKRKVFPYPILNKDKLLSNYGDCEFELKFDGYVDDDENNAIVFKNLRFDCTSNLLLDLYEEAKVEVVCIVECSNTIYRKTKRLTKDGCDLCLFKNDFSGKIFISIMAYATTDFSLKSSLEFEEDYQGIDFEISKYDIVAADDGISFPIEHIEKQDNLSKSIFAVIPAETRDKNTFDISLNKDRIEIIMSKESFKLYENIYDLNMFKNVYFSMMLVSALETAFSECKTNYSKDADISDIEDDYNWFRSITSAYQKLYGEELTMDKFFELRNVELAQDLLGSPVFKGFEEINKYTEKGDGFNEEE